MDFPIFAPKMCNVTMERSNPQNQTAPKGSPFTGILWGLLIVLLLNGLIFPSFSGGRIVETDYGTFISKVDSGLVRDVVIKNGEKMIQK